MLQQKNIVIIGGTSGIGLAAAKRFHEQGANIVCIGKNDDEANSIKIEASTYHTLLADATKDETAEWGISHCLEKFKGFDGLLHVAGGSGRKFGDGPLHELTVEAWLKTMELNSTSVMLSNKAAIKTFLELGKGGAIVNIGSTLATDPAPHFFSTHAYAASKAAVIGLSKSAASFYAKDNIRVNVISPGLVETPMSKRALENQEIMSYIKTKQPLDGGRIGHPDDLAELMALLLSDQGRFITGQNIIVDGAWSVSEGQY
jgi:NAD(P)-dependent dehydrogenase (short-subunit alcohol dehydrogenase family)